MKRYHMSLRATVVLSLTFLMAAAMLLIAVVMLKVSQRDLVEAKVDQGMLLKASLERLLGPAMGSGGAGLEGSPETSVLARFCSEAPEILASWHIIVADRHGRVVYASEGGGASPDHRLAVLEEVVHLGAANISFSPYLKALPWLLPEKLMLDAPLFRKARIIGAVRLETSLADVRQSLWRSQKLLLLYILVDLLVLVAFGSYVFSKLVVRPVERLVQTAEGFQEGDRLPDLESGEENELGKLARALNGMLQRLAENKQQLRQHITSLEQANLELQRAQQEVIFSEKLASVGRLAAGIAHEIGNPTGIVLGYLELLRREDLDEPERQELLARMAREIERIHQIIRQLLDLSRPASSERAPCQAHKLILETLGVVEHQLKRQGVEIVFDLEAEADTVVVNPDQLKQVLLNLLVNAADAMAAGGEGVEGGKLRLSTRTVSLEEPPGPGGGHPLRRRTDPPSANYRYLRQTHGLTTRGWLEIQVADTGSGIPEENMERVFEPFFTTKEPGQGTGLGLSVSLQLVEAMGGQMQLRSRPGEGTTVTILLPLEAEERDPDKDEPVKR